MSRDLAEIKEIRKEKANLERLIRSYQRRNEELKAKEAVLIKKMETLEPAMVNWKMSEEKRNSDGYIVGDPTFEVLKAVETPQRRMEKISQLREEVIQKQYENLKLEKELEARKEEHRQFSEMLTQRKNALGECIDGECSDFDDTSQEIADFKVESEDEKSEVDAQPLTKSWWF